MYSYEERVRAVKLYIKLDKRISAAIIQLGYLRTHAREAIELPMQAVSERCHWIA